MNSFHFTGLFRRNKKLGLCCPIRAMKYVLCFPALFFFILLIDVNSQIRGGVQAVFYDVIMINVIFIL